MNGDGKNKMSLKKKRTIAETLAIAGVVLIALALVIPLSSNAGDLLGASKWVYSSGALVYTIARTIDVSAPNESVRLKRMRRIEFWAGMAFIIGAAFWFYNESRYGDALYMFTLAILKDTILFSLVGAVLQIVASWMIYSRSRKENIES